ncbi:MAG: hypothetical protein H0V79_07130 [Actinobacteria bacterium]|nr:hypothetical protein [Actinomycetota bacterium]
MAAGNKTGEWRDGSSKGYDDFKDAIKKVLSDAPHDSEWTVGIEVKKRGNPVHDYRIVLQPK